MAITWQNNCKSESISSDAIKFVQKIIDDLKIGFIPLDEARIEKIDIRTEISPDIFVYYVVGDHKVYGDHKRAIVMRKNGSSWYSYLKD